MTAEAKTVLVGNPRAGGGRVGRSWPAYERAVVERFGACEPRLSEGPGGVEALAREAARGGASRIVVVGGDGSVNEAVNGVAAAAPAGGRPEVVVVPSGTGCDLARSVGASGLGPAEILERAEPRRVDLVRVEAAGEEGRISRLAVNIASFGASGLIVELVNRSSKRLGGRLGFALATIEGLARWRSRRVRLAFGDGSAREVAVSSVAVANGRYFGGGMKIAPEALLDDGELDVVVVGSAGVATFARHGRKLYRGEHLDLPEMDFRRCGAVEAEPVDGLSDPIPVETDGESCGRLPARFEVVPAAIVLSAPWGRAEALGPRRAP